ncbi:unnamed protein product [Mycena citricolor]|uniref:Uncharacterized protein n=1 Tax=Mycena citricolor TaxID=2018698 RepID=A0AAD2Q3G5_9AGAR|nr:unnamed protein product [Mycena citricolor]
MTEQHQHFEDFDPTVRRTNGSLETPRSYHSGDGGDFGSQSGDGSHHAPSASRPHRYPSGPQACTRSYAPREEDTSVIPTRSNAAQFFHNPQRASSNSLALSIQTNPRLITRLIMP